LSGPCKDPALGRQVRPPMSTPYPGSPSPAQPSGDRRQSAEQRTEPDVGPEVCKCAAPASLNCVGLSAVWGNGQARRGRLAFRARGDLATVWSGKFFLSARVAQIWVSGGQVNLWAHPTKVSTLEGIER
jgi:hypothetical protein